MAFTVLLELLGWPESLCGFYYAILQTNVSLGSIRETDSVTKKQKLLCAEYLIWSLKDFEIGWEYKTQGKIIPVVWGTAIEGHR